MPRNRYDWYNKDFMALGTPSSGVDLPILAYDTTRRIKHLTIETFPDGVLIISPSSKKRWIIQCSVFATLSLMMAIIQLFSENVRMSQQGIISRNGFQVVLTISLMICAISLVCLILTLSESPGDSLYWIRSGKFGYKRYGKISKDNRFDCALTDIVSIEYKLPNRHDQGMLEMTVRHIGKRVISIGLKCQDIKTVADTLIPVWKAHTSS